MNISQLLLDTYFGDNDSILVLGDFCEENNIYFQGLINANIEESLCINHDDYYRTGDNCGNGNGYGYDGYGYGYGNGYCNGDGDGNGHGGNGGNGVKEFYL